MSTSRLVRVWHLSSNRWNSAITEYALSSARALAQLGHPTLFTPLAASPAHRRAEQLGLPVAPLASFALPALRRARALAAAFAPDVIIVYGGPETVLGRLVRRGAALYRFQGQEVRAAGWRARARRLAAVPGVKVYIAPGRGLAAALRATVPHCPITTITLGCDTAKFFRQVGATRPEIVILGRFDPVKGHREFLPVMAQVLSAWGPSDPQRPQLHIVGEPANLTAQTLAEAVGAAGLRLGTDVRITAGRVADVGALLSRAALGLVPSLGSELICRVAEEVLLCGTPVVVSGVGSLEDVLIAGAGASYRGLAVDDTARLVGQWFRRGLSEDEAAKQERASAAAQVFSLEAMGRALGGILG